MALERLEHNHVDLAFLLDRHKRGDWGEADAELCFENDLAMYRKTGKICSVYRLANGEIVCILTEYNKAITTVGTKEEVE